MSATRATVLKLYKTLLRESDKFASYNYRTYALRRIRDAFRVNKTLTDKAEIEKEINYATEQLNIIRRQCLGWHWMKMVRAVRRCHQPITFLEWTRVHQEPVNHRAEEGHGQKFKLCECESAFSSCQQLCESL